MPTQETAAGALYSLASLATNRTIIAEVKGVAALVGVVERGSAQGREQAAGALLTLVQANSANQSAVSSELVAKLGEGSKATAEQAATSAASAPRVLATSAPAKSRKTQPCR